MTIVITKDNEIVAKTREIDMYNLRTHTGELVDTASNLEELDKLIKRYEEKEGNIDNKYFIEIDFYPDEQVKQ